MSECGFCKNWEQIAQQHCRDMHYFRGLVVQIGVMFGDAAYLAQDGSRPGGVLCAKVPDLVAKLIEEQADLKAAITPPHSVPEKDDPHTSDCACDDCIRKYP